MENSTITRRVVDVRSLMSTQGIYSLCRTMMVWSHLLPSSSYLLNSRVISIKFRSNVMNYEIKNEFTDISYITFLSYQSSSYSLSSTRQVSCSGRFQAAKKKKKIYQDRSDQEIPFVSFVATTDGSRRETVPAHRPFKS